MISIKKLLNASPDAETTTLRRTGTLLLEGIALHAVECDPADRAAFQNSVRRFRRDMEEAKQPADILVSTGSVIQLLEQYNRGIERFIRVRGKEYQEVVGMFSKALIEISNAGESAVQNLQSIEKSLLGISQIDDMRDLKVKLGESLKSLSEETVRQKVHSKELAGNLVESLKTATAAFNSKPMELDAATGLPGHTAATREISALIAAGESRYVAIFCVERLDLINKRFGFAVGDQILMMFSQYVAQQLSGNDKLFRWRGPGVIAILPRDCGQSEVQAELRHAAAERLEHSVTIGTRLVLLPISQAWSLMKLSSNTPAEELFARIDTFVASQAAKSSSA